MYIIINILLISVLLFIIVDRFRPVKGLVQLDEKELKEKLKKPKNVALIDVRQPYEFKTNHIPGAINLPLPDLRKRKAEIPVDKEIILYCQTGIRSTQAARALQRKYKLNQVSHLKGGLYSWEEGSIIARKKGSKKKN